MTGGKGIGGLHRWGGSKGVDSWGNRTIHVSIPLSVSGSSGWRPIRLVIGDPEVFVSSFREAGGKAVLA